MPKAPKPINNTTFEVELLGKDKVEIGDKESTDFKPHIKLNRWDGECFIKVSLPTTEKPKAIVEGDKIKFGGKDIEAVFYPLEPTTIDGFTQNELGGFEFEIILKKKPVSNKIVLNIETQELKFYYQPELTPEEVAEGSVRPDNVVGSYAVYHATRTPFHKSKEDADKYKVGKAFHIYRPKITDTEGKWVWGELSLDEQAGTLTTTVSQDFLDKAVYPVSVDPIFGYDTPGGTWDYNATGWQYASRFTSGDAGTIASMSVYGKIITGGYRRRLVIYLYDSPDTRIGYTGHITGIQAEGWLTTDIVDGGDVAASTEYWLSDYCEHGDVQRKYDSDASSPRRGGRRGITYNTPPSTWNPQYTAQRKRSIYCTYEVGGEALTKALADTVTIGDSISKAITKIATDTITISDTFSYIRGLFKTLTDSIGITDSLIKAVSIAKTETVAITDSIKKAVSIAKTETITIGESIVKGIGLIRSETVAVTDTFAKAVEFFRGISDSVSITETISKAVSIIKVDTVAVVDTISKGFGLVKAEAISVSDAVVKAIGLVRAETVNIVDSLVTLKSIFKSLSDSVGVTDTIGKAVSLAKSDSIAIVDSISKAIGLIKSDSVAIVDVFSWAIIKAIAITVYLYARSITVSLYARSISVALYQRAITVSLYLRNLTVALYNRALSLKTRGAR